MRTICAAVVLLTALAPAARAAGRVALCPQVGVNASRLTSDPDETDTKARVGYQLGGYLRLGQGIYLQPGAFYQRTGTKLEGKKGLTFDGVKDNADVTSIHVPLLIGVDLIAKPAFTLRVNGGVAGTVVTKVDANDFGLTKDDYKDVIGGAIGGVGIDFGILTIDGSLEIGLTDTFKNGESASKQNVARLGVGLKIG